MINTRLAIAIHILSVVIVYGDNDNLNSELIAKSIQTNPVVVRRMTSAMKKSGILRAIHGNRGLELTKGPSEISFLDILKSVDEDNEIFSVHRNANLNCKIGKNIEGTLNR